MPLPKDPFRQFQEELAALELQIEQRRSSTPHSSEPAQTPAPASVRKPPPPPVISRPPGVKRFTKQAAARLLMEQAKIEFLDLRQRFSLTVADVVAFFPPEEGVAYLESLIAAQQNKPRRGRKPKALLDDDMSDDNEHSGEE